MQKQIDGKKFVSDILLNQKKVYELLKKGLKKDYTDEDIIDFFLKANENNLLASSKIGERIADFFQLLWDDSENWSSATLEVIEEIYKSAIECNPYDITLYESLAHYVDAVLDKPEEAKDLLKQGLEKINLKLREVEVYYKGIE
ncbi:MAG: hypothetical protein QM781_21400 [Chitinophagaceae bacterium]|jgi:tetratricopeptide (TPR) repeat protein